MSLVAMDTVSSVLVVREGERDWNRALDWAGLLVWLSDGREPVGPEPLAVALDARPAASFAVAVRRRSVARELPGLLSGTALGCAVLLRGSALRTVGGIDEAAPGAAAAQWDLAVRLAEAGHEWIEVGGVPRRAPGLTDRAGPEAARWMYRRHARLYEQHLSEVLLDRQRAIGRLVLSVDAEEQALLELDVAVESSRRERDRLAAKLRRSHRSLRRWGDLWRPEPFACDPSATIERHYVDRFLEHHVAERDAVLLVHVLHESADPAATLAEHGPRLDSGAALLATVPFVGGFSEHGFRELVESALHPAAVEVRTAGNRVALAASIAGIPAHALGPEALEPVDPAAPVVLTARAVRR